MPAALLSESLNSQMVTKETIRVGLFTREPIRVAGLTCIADALDEENSSNLIPVTGTAEELLTDPDLKYLVVDLNSHCCTPKTPETIRRLRPDIRQIVIGHDGDRNLAIGLIAAGARAYLDCSAEPETLRRAIRAVAAGGIWASRQLLSELVNRLLADRDEGPFSANPQLTVREGQVLNLILMARSNREIANELGIEERTVQAHVSRLMRKAGAENRVGLTMQAMSSLAPSTAAIAERGQTD